MLGVIQRVFQELGGVIRAALFARQIAVLLGEDLAQHRRVFGAFIGRNRQRGYTGNALRTCLRKIGEQGGWESHGLAA